MSKVDTKHQLSVKRQCELLDVCRSSFYYIPREDSSYNEELMELIDKQYTKTPFMVFLVWFSTCGKTDIR